MNWQKTAAWLLLLVLAARVLLFAHTALDRPSHGFVSHYTASRLLLEGQDPARFYDEQWFLEQLHRFEPGVEDYFGANLPSTAFLVLPVAGFGYETARASWVYGSACLFLGIVAWLAARLQLGYAQRAGLFLLLLFFQPLYESLARGQMYVAMLALLVVAWQAYMRRRDAALAGSLGAALLLKSAALMMWPLLLAQRAWRALGAAALMIAAGIALVTLVCGAAAWTAYFDAATELPRSPYLLVTAYQSLTSLLARPFLAHGLTNPQPIADLAFLGRTLPAIAVLALVSLSMLVAAKAGRSKQLFAAFVCLSLIASPVSLDYHYVMALLPIMLLLSTVSARLLSAEWLVFLAGTLLIAADLPYRHPAISAGWPMLLAYPKVYGGLLLWGLALFQAGRGARP